MNFPKWKMDMTMSLVMLSLMASPWIISWYGGSDGFHGRPTASGVPFDSAQLTTACHGSIPLGTVIEVTNPQTGASVQVECNDRGPFRWTGRGWEYISPYRLDLSEAAFRAIANTSQGIINGAEVVVGARLTEEAEAVDDIGPTEDGGLEPSGQETTPPAQNTPASAAVQPASWTSHAAD